MSTRYLKLSKNELNKRTDKLYQKLEKCDICPKKCRVNRLKGEKGYCRIGSLPIVSSFHSHFGEESVLVGKRGSGTIFFAGCNLSCVYCQNYEISQLKAGQEVSFEDLAEMMIELQRQGCHNINLVTPTPQVPQIIKALEIAIERGLRLPLVYNTNSYDSTEVLKLLDGIVDIYMPDVKYSDEKLALKYSLVPDYFEITKRNLKEMHFQVGDLKCDKNGIAFAGLLVRHLVLPNNLAGSEKIFEFIAKEISKNTFLNIMDQYYPAYQAFDFPELARKITDEEYQKVLSLTEKYGLNKG